MVEQWKLMAQTKDGQVRVLETIEGSEYRAWERADELMADFDDYEVLWCEPVTIRKRLEELGLLTETSAAVAL